MSFLIQNLATRESLKNAFDNLFAKYDKEFTDDDEIDLSDLSLAKKGQHLSRLSHKQNFGCVFRRISYTSSNSDYHREINLNDGTKDILDLPNFVISKSARVSKLKKDQSKPLCFDMLLWNLILFEEKFKKNFRKELCKCGLCFDCVLYVMDISNK